MAQRPWRLLTEVLQRDAEDRGGGFFDVEPVAAVDFGTSSSSATVYPGHLFNGVPEDVSRVARVLAALRELAAALDRSTPSS
ncbi:hypothetical protein ACFV3E_35550 [Streptomyces sp. NPDC059718]